VKVAVNAALLAPAATVTLAGIETVGPVVVWPSDTFTPPDGAAPARVTVHCEEPPDVTDAGEHDKPLSAGARVIPPSTPVTAMGSALAEAASSPVS
jgi:hypothetical protein